MRWYLYNQQGRLIKDWPATKGGRMTVNEYALILTKFEHGKKQVNIAQIKELLKVINSTMNGEFYKAIRKM